MIGFSRGALRTAHCTRPLETPRCVERRGSLSYRARLSLSRRPRPRRALPADRQTSVPIHTARVRRTPRPGKVVVSCFRERDERGARARGV